MFSRALPRASSTAFQCLRPACQGPQSPAANFPMPSASRRIPQHIRPLQPRRNITISIGHRGKGTRIEQIKQAARQNPFSFSLAMICLTGAVGAFVYAQYKYITYAIGAFHRFPAPVAKELRKAVYYTNMQLNVEKAVEHYQKALEACKQEQLHPFSDEVLGIKVMVAVVLEKAGYHEKAAMVLDTLRKLCFDWVEREGPQHMTNGHRSRVLKKTVELGLKIAELYSDPHVKKQDEAEEVLVSAVETVLKEKQRRETEGVKEGEGEWISDEEAGASYEALAHQYESTDRHYLATPLFLQALTLCPPKSCHSAILMNNVATSLAQQKVPASFYQTSPTSSLTSSPAQPPSRTEILHQATLWTNKALQLATSITPAQGRTEECDIGCAVATHNLGEFAEMAGDYEEASKRYAEARSLAKAIGYEEGVKQAVEGMRRIHDRNKQGGKG